MTGDEERVLERLRRRLEMGAKQYGELRVTHDPRARNWSEEAEAEALDLCVYLAAAKMREAEMLAENRRLNEALTEVQARCNELLEESRRRKAAVAMPPPDSSNSP